MILEVIATAFIAAYIGLVIFGHGLLFIAILKCLVNVVAGGGDPRPTSGLAQMRSRRRRRPHRLGAVFLHDYATAAASEH
jgi:hypothetical protein